MSYTPPNGDAVDFNLDNNYTPPSGDAVDFTLNDSTIIVDCPPFQLNSALSAGSFCFTVTPHFQTNSALATNPTTLLDVPPFQLNSVLSGDPPLYMLPPVVCPPFSLTGTLSADIVAGGTVIDVPPFQLTSSLSAAPKFKFVVPPFSVENTLWAVPRFIAVAIDCPAFAVNCTLSAEVVGGATTIVCPPFQMTGTLSATGRIVMWNPRFTETSTLSVTLIPHIMEQLSVPAFSATGALSVDIFRAFIVQPPAFVNTIELSVDTLFGLSIPPFSMVSDLAVGKLRFPQWGHQRVETSFGEQLHASILAALGITEFQLNRLDLSPGAWAIQQAMTKLCQGDPTGRIEAILNKVVEQAVGIMTAKNMLSGSRQSIQEMVTKLCQGDPTGRIESILSKLNHDASGVASFINILSTGLQRVQELRQVLSSDEVSAIQSTVIELAEKDLASGIQHMVQSLSDISVNFHNTTYAIYLDGTPIKSRIHALRVSYGEFGVHNSIEFSSLDRDLFMQADPSTSSGTSRIELQVGSRVLYFLVEERSGDEQSFSIWGRSLSAVQDSPYTNDVDYTLDTPTLASEVAAGLVSCALDWQCDDWVLPEGFEFSGPPIEGVQSIAQAIGAIVRSADDGSLIVRAKYPVRPVDMQTASATVNYVRSSLLALNSSESRGAGYNAIEVLGATTDLLLPDMEVEESSPDQGDDVHVHVYWAGQQPDIVETYVTDGTITDLGMHTETVEEVVVFQEGAATLNHPLETLVSVEWIGDAGEDISYEQYSKELHIANNAYRICRINYTTSYQRYWLREHNVEMLLAVLSIGTDPDVSVLIKIDTGDRPADSVSDALLTTDRIAVVRGMAELDNSRYDQKAVTLTAPYNDDAVDGVLVYINDDAINCTGNFHIKKADIVFDGPKVTNEIEVVQCQVS